jgi:hypothetical protein
MGARLLAILAFAASAAGCSKQIGQACATNVDCSPLGDRFCDISAPGGYCTIEGCDVSFDSAGKPVSSCPDDGVCIRFFERIATCPCNPETADQDCAPSQRCLCDEQDPQNPGQCKKTNAIPGPATCGSGADGGAGGSFYGHCAPESSERRSCMRRCNSNADCRPDVDSKGNAVFECRSTGTNGAEPVPTSRTDGGVTLPVGTPASFCVQKA